jgi:hypothetical protein
VQIISINGRIIDAAEIKNGGWTVWGGSAHFRPLTPADWVKEVDGVKYRAYEGKNGIPLLTTREEGTACNMEFFLPEWVRIFKKFTESNGIPIMPYELSQGKYEYPE